MECLGWKTTASTPALTFSSSHICRWSMSSTVLVLALPPLLVIHKQAAFLESTFYMLNIEVVHEVLLFYPWCLNCRIADMTSALICNNRWCFGFDQVYIHLQICVFESIHQMQGIISSWLFFLSVSQLWICPSHIFPSRTNWCFRKGHMAGFKHLSTDEWSYLPSRWALLEGSNFGPLIYKKEEGGFCFLASIKSVCLPSLLNWSG